MRSAVCCHVPIYHTQVQHSISTGEIEVIGWLILDLERPDPAFRLLLFFYLTKFEFKLHKKKKGFCGFSNPLSIEFTVNNRVACTTPYHEGPYYEETLATRKSLHLHDETKLRNNSNFTPFIPHNFLFSSV